MADIQLDDLLKQKAGTAPAAEPRQELLHITRQVETITPEERQKIDAIKETIDLVDSSRMLQYGNGAQKQIADFSNSILSSVRADAVPQVDGLLTDLVGRVKAFSPEPETESTFLSSLPIVGALFKKKEELTAAYPTVSAQIDRIQAGLDNARTDLLKDIVMFDSLYQKNLAYFKQLQLYIQAGEEKLAELRTHTIPSLQAQSQASDNPMAAQVVKDFEESVNRFEKKVHDLTISKTIALQTAPQVRLIQNNDNALVDRIQHAN